MKYNFPQISIIVPVFNASKFLNQCVDSILSQSFEKFELILIDDGSTDSTLDICNNYARMDSRIVVLTKKNGGVSSARNVGLSVARGKYIMFCDSDDYVHTEWCSDLYEQIVNHPNAWIVADMCRFTEEKCITQITTNNLTKDELTYFVIFSASLSPYTWNKIYSSRIIAENNISFDETRTIGEDVIFNVQYYSFCSEILYLPKILYYYRHTPTSATSTYRSNLFDLNVELFKSRLPLIQEHEIKEFCNIYFYMFIQWLENVLDKRNPMSFIQKMRYNNKMMNTEEFRFCVSHATGNNDSELFMKIVKKHNYYLYWLFQKACVIKGKLFNRKTGDKQ